MKIAVFGTGGVGGYFGGRLGKAGEDVHLIARGSHLEALRASGLKVRSVKGDFEVSLPATDRPAEIGPCDLVLFTVKSYDTETAASQLEPLLGPGTAVVSLQNGVENEHLLARAVGRERVMGGVAYIFSEKEEPGTIAHTGGPAKLVFGELDGSRSERGLSLLEACVRAGVDAELSEDVRGALWFKFALICALAGTTAVIRLPIGEIRETPESWQMFRRILEEVYALAVAEGVGLPEDTVERHLGFASGLEPTGYSSLHYDMTHGRPMELEALHGSVVRLARKHGLPAPVTESIYAILRPWSDRNLRDHPDIP